MKIYGYNAAGALARFLERNKDKNDPAYLLENAFRYWKSVSKKDTTVTGEDNYNKDFDYTDLYPL